MPDYDVTDCDDWCQKQAINLASLFVANLEQFIRYKDKPVNVLISRFLTLFDSAVQNKIFPIVSTSFAPKCDYNGNVERRSKNECKSRTSSVFPAKKICEESSFSIESIPITWCHDRNHLIMKSVIKMRVESNPGDDFFDAVVSMQEHSSSYFLEFSFGYKKSSLLIDDIEKVEEVDDPLKFADSHICLLIKDSKGVNCVIQFFSKEEKQQWLIAFRNFFGDRITSYLSSNPYQFEMPTEDNENSTSEDARLRLLPWYHGHLSRSDAARIVIRGHHGSYLLRNSETRRDELVLTFNVVGRAKHLRLSLLKDGRCIVQNMQFESVRHMVEHFKMTPSVFLKNGSDPQRFELINWIPRLIPRHGVSAKDQSIDNSYGIC